MITPCTPDRHRCGVVAAATLGMGAGFGGMTTVSSLIAPLESDLGVLRSDVSLAYTLTTLGVALGGPCVGRLTDRHSTRPIVMAGAAMLCRVVMATPHVHLMPLAVAGGADGETASAVLATMVVAGCLSRVLAGAVADRLGALATYALVSAAQTAAVCLSIVPPGGLALHAAAAVYGFAFGGVMTGLVCTVRAAVPSAVLGLSMSVVGLAAWAGMGVGGYQGGLCFDLTGFYATSFVSAALAGVANLAVLALLSLRLRKVQARPPMIRSTAA